MTSADSPKFPVRKRNESPTCVGGVAPAEDVATPKMIEKSNVLRNFKGLRCLTERRNALRKARLPAHRRRD
jgi:hypothetical protein